MSLKRGYSPEIVAENIAMMISEGYPQKQAIAASLEDARRYYFKVHPGGYLPPHLKLPGGRRDRDAWEISRHRDNPVPESTRSRARSRESRIQSAGDLYTRFTGHDAVEFVEVDKPEIPDTLAVIGDVDGVMYTTVRDNQIEKYIHKFKKNCRPLLCVSSDGKQLFMLGGAYDFTERGIVDRS